MNKEHTELSLQVLDILYIHKDGLTWKELQVILRDEHGVKAHHGQVSGALSKLHGTLDVFRLRLKRDNCQPYVHSAFRNEYSEQMRVDFPSRRNKWEAIADFLYFVMTADNIPADAWDSALKNYEDNKK